MLVEHQIAIYHPVESPEARVALADSSKVRRLSTEVQKRKCERSLIDTTAWRLTEDLTREINRLKCVSLLKMFDIRLLHYWNQRQAPSTSSLI